MISGRQKKISALVRLALCVLRVLARPCVQCSAVHLVSRSDWGWVTSGAANDTLAYARLRAEPLLSFNLLPHLFVTLEFHLTCLVICLFLVQPLSSLPPSQSFSARVRYPT